MVDIICRRGNLKWIKGDPGNVFEVSANCKAWRQSWIQHGRLCWKLTKSTVSLWPRTTHWQQSRPYRQQSRPSWRQCRPRQAVEFKLLPICCQNRQQSRPYRRQSTLLPICRQFRQQSTLSPVCTGLKRQQCELGQRLFVAGCRFSADVPLTASDRIEPVKENEKHTIVIKKVVKAEEGVINVKATNEVGQMSASARLKVTGIPEYRTYSLIFIEHQTRDIDIGILSIRPSVCLSVRYVPVFYENGITYTGFRKITATKNNSHFFFLHNS